MDFEFFLPNQHGFFRFTLKKTQMDKLKKDENLISSVEFLQQIHTTHPVAKQPSNQDDLKSDCADFKIHSETVLPGPTSSMKVMGPSQIALGKHTKVRTHLQFSSVLRCEDLNGRRGTVAPLSIKISNKVNIWKIFEVCLMLQCSGRNSRSQNQRTCYGVLVRLQEIKKANQEQ